jgi:hypothetical protein
MFIGEVIRLSWRSLHWVACVAAVLVAGAAQAASLDRPALAGMRPLAGNVYIDPSLPDDQAEAGLALLEAARQRVAAVYGDLEARPNIVFCASADCYRSFGAIGLGFTDGKHIVFAPEGRSVAIIAHELAHVEFAARIGGFDKVLKTVPQWFDEGQAVMVSMAEEFSDHAWSHATGNGRHAPDLGTLASMDEWMRITGVKGENMQLSYGTARREVSRWFGHCGCAGLSALISALQANEPFAKAYARIEAEAGSGRALPASGGGLHAAR